MEEESVLQKCDVNKQKVSLCRYEVTANVIICEKFRVK